MVLFSPDFEYKVDRGSVFYLKSVMHWQQYARHIILNYIWTVKFLDNLFANFRVKSRYNRD